MEHLLRARGEYRPHPEFGVNLHVPWSAGTQEEASWSTPSTSYNTTRELQGSSDHNCHGDEPAPAGTDGFMSLAAAAGVRSSILPPKQVRQICHTQRRCRVPIAVERSTSPSMEMAAHHEEVEESHWRASASVHVTGCPHSARSLHSTRTLRIEMGVRHAARVGANATSYSDGARPVNPTRGR